MSFRYLIVTLSSIAINIYYYYKIDVLKNKNKILKDLLIDSEQVNYKLRNDIVNLKKNVVNLENEKGVIFI